jgi:hypothetical protein
LQKRLIELLQGKPECRWFESTLSHNDFLKKGK